MQRVWTCLNEVDVLEVALRCGGVDMAIPLILSLRQW
jgi:hypothetical protein